ncbi:MAG: DCC1-like thiol-disulfide oxidoreductase family protein [Cyanobacteria bacterium P01_G01_bin.38]
MHYVIYDGLCNLCVTLVKFLEVLDGGQRFQYVSMQDEAVLVSLQVTPDDCELGMILINVEHPEQRWQGSDAAEEIGRILPFGAIFVGAYQALPGVKRTGDQFYAFIRDNRYRLFGKRQQIYGSIYPVCNTDRCDRYFPKAPQK